MYLVRQRCVQDFPDGEGGSGLQPTWHPPKKLHEIENSRTIGGVPFGSVNVRLA